MGMVLGQHIKRNARYGFGFGLSPLSTRWFLELRRQQRAGCLPGRQQPVQPLQQLWLPPCSQRQLALASSARKLLNSFRFCGSTNPRRTIYGCRKKAQTLQAEPRQRAKRLGWSILSAKSWFKSTAFLSKREQDASPRRSLFFMSKPLL